MQEKIFSQDEKLSLKSKQEENVKDNKESLLIRHLREIYNAHKNNTERIGDIMAVIEPVAKLLLNSDTINNMQDALKNCINAENEAEFIKQAAIALKPLLDLKESHNEQLQKIQRENFFEQENIIPLNELLAYDIHNDCVNIHVAPGEDIKDMRKLVLIRDGLQKLAIIIQDQPQIKFVKGESWIIATPKGKEILKKLGFTVEDEILDATQANNFYGDDRKVGKAKINREEFLELYLKP